MFFNESLKDSITRIQFFLAKRTWLVGLVLGLAVGAAVSLLFISNVSFLAAWQQSISDYLFMKQAPDSNIVIVGVDQRSLKELGRWPWDRSMHAALIDVLAKGGAKTIAFDLGFSETSQAGEDIAMAASLKKADNVILAAMFDLTGTQDRYDVCIAVSGEEPAPVLAKSAAGIGHVNVFPDADGVVRSLPLLIDLKGEQFPAFGLAALGQKDASYKVPPQTGERGVFRLLGKTIPVQPGARMRINYGGPGGTYKTVSYADALDGTIDPNTFEDKIVLVGVTAKALGDQYMTPVSEGTPMYGVEVHANAIDTIMNGKFISDQAPYLTVIILLGLSVFSGLVFMNIKARWSILIATGLAALTVAFVIVRFEQGVIVNFVYPQMAIFGTYLAVMTTRFVTEGSERRKVQSLFGRYVKPEIVQQIVDTAEKDIVRLEGYSQEVTIFFADIRGFTSMSENLSPPRIVTMLNRYLDFMTEIIFKHDGTLDKYIGDAIMAFFNAPHKQPDHALRAVKAALEMQSEVKRIGDAGDDEIPIAHYGIGINTGEAVVGNIGGSKRHDYTIIGDSVNFASRLCGAAEPGQVIISESTYELVKEFVVAEELPPMKFKGKAKPMSVYNVINLKQRS